MEGIIWLFLIALVALSAVLVRLHWRLPRSSLDHCPNCRTPMSLRRVSMFDSPTLRRMWVCPHCRARIKAGKVTSGTAS